MRQAEKNMQPQEANKMTIFATPKSTLNLTIIEKKGSKTMHYDDGRWEGGLQVCHKKWIHDK